MRLTLTLASRGNTMCRAVMCPIELIQTSNSLLYPGSAPTSGPSWLFSALLPSACFLAAPFREIQSFTACPSHYLTPISLPLSGKNPVSISLGCSMVKVSTSAANTTFPNSLHPGKTTVSQISSCIASEMLKEEHVAKQIVCFHVYNPCTNQI